MTKEEINDLYFWYDAETGEVEALVEEEFTSRVQEIMTALRRWEDVVEPS